MQDNTSNTISETKSTEIEIGGRIELPKIENELVYFETRIANKSLLQSNTPNTHNAFREYGKEDILIDPWRACIVDKTNGTINIFSSNDYNSTKDPMTDPFSNEWANIYRDNCLYYGNSLIGYQRKQERIAKILKMTFDFDSHTDKDMPKKEIESILMSPKFQELPFEILIDTGNGFQAHFKIGSSLITDENRNDTISAYKKYYAAIIQYFILEFGLKPDAACSDPNRLHRKTGTYNTKRCIGFNKEDRVAVKIVCEKVVDKKEVRKVFDEILEKYGKTIEVSEEVNEIKDAPIDLNNVISALNKINPDDAYNNWWSYGAAIKLAFGEIGFKVWDDWSKLGSKYNEQEMKSKWDSFKRESGSVVTIASIFKVAKDNGWEEQVNKDMECLGMAQGNAQDNIDTDRNKSVSPISFKDLMVKEFKDPEWIVKEIIPEGLTMFFGKEKIGKSYWILSMAYAISRGIPVFGSIESTKTPTLYLALEDTMRRLKNRVSEFESYRGRSIQDNSDAQLYFATKESNVENMDAGFFKYLDSFLDEHPVKLIIIDTIVRVASAPSMKKDAYQNTSAVAIKLHNYASKRGLSIIFVHHESKNHASQDTFDAASGGKGLGAQSDTQIRLERGRMDSMGTLSVTGRDVQEKIFAMEFKNQDWVVMDQNIVDSATGKELQIINAINNKFVKAKQIQEYLEAEGVKMAISSLRVLLTRMYQKGLIGRSERGSYYIMSDCRKEKEEDKDLFNN